MTRDAVLRLVDVATQVFGFAFAGLATIAAGHRLATQFSRPRQVLTAPLTAALAHRTSHIAQRPFLPPLLTSLWFTLALPFVVYSTEARGYALALAAMVGCLTFLSSADVCVNRGVSPARGPEGEAPKSFPPSLLKLVTYWLLCAIGLTAHFSFIHALVGFLFLVRPLKRNLT